jgi:hypothetical protein
MVSMGLTTESTANSTRNSFRLACQSRWGKHPQFHGTRVSETQYFVEAKYCVSRALRHYRRSTKGQELSRLLLIDDRL